MIILMNTRVNKVAKYLIVSLILSIAFYSCSLIGVEDLGCSYYFDTDLILKSIRKGEPSTGTVVIPPKVILYDYDKRWIIAKSINGAKTSEYWIIDKSDSTATFTDSHQDSLHWVIYRSATNVKGPLDSIEFLKEVAVNKIELQIE